MSDSKKSSDPDSYMLWKILLMVFVFLVARSIATQFKSEINAGVAVAVIMGLVLIGWVWHELNELWGKGLNFQFFLTDLFAVALSLPPLAALILRQMHVNRNDPNVNYALPFLIVEALAGIGGVMIGRMKIQQQQEGGGLETQIGYSLVFQLAPFFMALLYVW